jgi:head-tail adaptor
MAGLRPAGRRRHRITIERRTASQHPDTGQPVETWLRVASRLAEKGYRSAREGIEAGGVQAIRVVRYAVLRDDVTRQINPHEFRVVDGGVVHDLIEVNEIGDNAGVEMFAETRAE